MGLQLNYTVGSYLVVGPGVYLMICLTTGVYLDLPTDTDLSLVLFFRNMMASGRQPLARASTHLKFKSSKVIIILSLSNPVISKNAPKLNNWNMIMTEGNEWEKKIKILITCY